MCSHDPVFKQENETHGGQGCPLCLRLNRRRRKTNQKTRDFYDSLADHERAGRDLANRLRKPE